MYPSATARDAVTPRAARHAFCQVANLHTQRIPQEEFAHASPRYNILYWPDKGFESDGLCTRTNKGNGDLANTTGFRISEQERLCRSI